MRGSPVQALACIHEKRWLPCAGNWFEDRFLEAEGTAIDPVLRPYSGPEEPLVGATKGAKLTGICFVMLQYHLHGNMHNLAFRTKINRFLPQLSFEFVERRET